MDEPMTDDELRLIEMGPTSHKERRLLATIARERSKLVRIRARFRRLAETAEAVIESGDETTLVRLCDVAKALLP